MDKINEIAFNKGLRKINEGGINRIMSHGKNGFIVISANRSEVYSDNPQCDLSDEYKRCCQRSHIEDYDNEETMQLWLNDRNAEAERRLRNDLKASPYAFTPVYGGYHGSDDVVDSFEPSYIVYNHVKGGGSGDHLDFEKLKQFGIDLAKKYKQESVYVQGPDEAPNYIGQDGTNQNSDSSKNFKINRDDEMFYTTAKRDKTNPQRFTADIQFESMYRKAGPSTYFERVKRTKLGEVFLD